MPTTNILNWAGPRLYKSLAIGGSLGELREEALAAARAIGKVAVDHGETGCKTPDAAAYIERMAARPARRTRGAAKTRR